MGETIRRCKSYVKITTIAIGVLSGGLWATSAELLEAHKGYFQPYAEIIKGANPKITKESMRLHKITRDGVIGPRTEVYIGDQPPWQWRLYKEVPLAQYKLEIYKKHQYNPVDLAKSMQGISTSFATTDVHLPPARRVRIHETVEANSTPNTVPVNPPAWVYLKGPVYNTVRATPPIAAGVAGLAAGSYAGVALTHANTLDPAEWKGEDFDLTQRQWWPGGH